MCILCKVNIMGQPTCGHAFLKRSMYVRALAVRFKLVRFKPDQPDRLLQPCTCPCINPFLPKCLSPDSSPLKWISSETLMPFWIWAMPVR